MPATTVQDQADFQVDVWHDSIKLCISTKQKSIWLQTFQSNVQSEVNMRELSAQLREELQGANQMCHRVTGDVVPQHMFELVSNKVQARS